MAAAPKRPRKTAPKPAAAAPRTRGHMIHVEVDQATLDLLERAAREASRQLGLERPLGLSTWLRAVARKEADRLLRRAGGRASDGRRA